MNDGQTTPRTAQLLTRAAFGGLWLAAVLVGLGVVVAYSKTPGTTGSAPESWPAASTVPRSASKATLVMLVHPRCPCSRASIDELARLMAVSSDRLVAYVLVWTPHDASNDWENTLLLREAKEIPGVHVLRDDRGAESSRFHAETSGQTVVYGRDGSLLFTGGITSARGHSGDNEGRSSIVALLSGAAGSAHTPVFGCPFFGTDDLRTP